MGLNADTGGQVKYVLELAEALGDQDGVARVDLITRFIRDKTLSPDYGKEIEPISENVRIVRIACGGFKYIRKENLWPHLDEFVDKTLKFIKQEGQTPDVVHGHYADSGYVAKELAAYLGVPFVFTGHSLGRSKKRILLTSGLSEDEMNRKFRIDHRIEVEESIIRTASLIVASTKQEIEEQYGQYESNLSGNCHVITPGIDVDRFFPFYDEQNTDQDDLAPVREAQFFMLKELERFLISPEKPIILALSRPDKRKNIPALITAYGEDKELQAIANLAVFAGIRKDINTMDDNEREVLTELLLLMDNFDLYGKLAIPKKHDFEYEVPELFRIAARTQGVFVNSAFTEPFGLTLIEAAASGLPIVATNDGGPRDILQNCQNGILIDVNSPKKMSNAIKKILVDKELWKTYSHNGIKGVRKHYMWSVHCEKYFGHIKALSTGKKTQAAPGADPGVIGQKLTRVEKLLIVDIDNTLLGDMQALKKLVKVLGQNDKEIAFGVATGRTVFSAQKVLAENKIPHPDIIVSSVGAEIYYGKNLMPDKGWHSHLSSKWDPVKIKETLSELDFLNLQEEDTQREFKISYYMKDSAENLAMVHYRLTEKGLRYSLIYSNGLFLDILPYRASKGKAIRYLGYKWNIPLENVLTAGDSGNDEDMLKGDLSGVVVANHTPDLNKLRGLKRVYYSNQKHAAGILDGMRYYEFIDHNDSAN